MLASYTTVGAHRGSRQTPALLQFWDPLLPLFTLLLLVRVIQGSRLLVEHKVG